MKFLIDEDVPVALLKTLKRAGHDAIRVTPSTPDPIIADQARAEGRILITLDKDFTNTKLYPPTQLTTVHIQIHPPYAKDIIEAFQTLLTTLAADKLSGLILLGKAGVIRIIEDASPSEG